MIVNLHLLMDAVVLHFKIIIVGTEGVLIPQSGLPCAIQIFLKDFLRHLPGQTAGKCNQPFMVLLQNFTVYAGLIIKAFQRCQRLQPGQIAVALFIFHQQHQMIGAIIQPGLFIKTTAGCHIHLTADDWLHTGFFAGLVKIDYPVHHAVVGYGNGRLV